MKRELMDDEIQRLYLYLMEQHYISENGTPLKCPHCGSVDIGQGQAYYENGYNIEHEDICNVCQTPVGYWAYGQREPFWEYYADLIEQV